METNDMVAKAAPAKAAAAKPAAKPKTTAKPKTAAKTAAPKTAPSKELVVTTVKTGTMVDFPEPLTEAKAKALDKKVRAAGVKAAASMADLLDLLEEAAVGQIHTALGYASWTAWVSEAVQIAPTDENERKAFVSMMSGKGMSQRAIADVVGVNQATISRDLSGDADASTGKTTGKDGKEYDRTPKADKIIDAEVVDVEPEAKPQPLSSDFSDEMDYLNNSVLAFKDLVEDERFEKGRKTIAKRFLNKLTENISELQKVVDLLMD